MNPAAPFSTPPSLLLALHQTLAQLNQQFQTERDLAYELWRELGFATYNTHGTGPGIIAALDNVLHQTLHALQTRFGTRFLNVSDIFAEAQYVLAECEKEGLHAAGARYLAYAERTLGEQQALWQLVLASAISGEDMDAVEAWCEFSASLAFPDEDAVLGLDSGDEDMNGGQHAPAGQIE